MLAVLRKTRYILYDILHPLIWHCTYRLCHTLSHKFIYKRGRSVFKVTLYLQHPGHHIPHFGDLLLVPVFFHIPLQTFWDTELKADKEANIRHNHSSILNEQMQPVSVLTSNKPPCFVGGGCNRDGFTNSFSKRLGIRSSITLCDNNDMSYKNMFNVKYIYTVFHGAYLN